MKRPGSRPAPPVSLLRVAGMVVLARIRDRIGFVGLRLRRSLWHTALRFHVAVGFDLLFRLDLLVVRRGGSFGRFVVGGERCRGRQGQKDRESGGGGGNEQFHDRLLEFEVGWSALAIVWWRSPACQYGYPMPTGRGPGDYKFVSMQFMPGTCRKRGRAWKSSAQAG